MRTILSLISFSLLFACGSNNFSGSESAKKTAGSSSVPAGEEPSEKMKPDQNKSDLVQKGKPILADEAEEILAEDGELSEEDKKVVGCIEQWGQTNLSKTALLGYKKQTAKNEGFASSVLKDTKKTDEPRLVFVSAASTGFSGVRMELLNPNGWYCVDVKNVGFSGSNLMLHCDSELAGFNAENKGFSNTQETRVGC